MDADVVTAENIDPNVLAAYHQSVQEGSQAPLIRECLRSTVLGRLNNQGRTVPSHPELFPAYIPTQPSEREERKRQKTKERNKASANKWREKRKIRVARAEKINKDATALKECLRDEISRLKRALPILQKTAQEIKACPIPQFSAASFHPQAFCSSRTTVDAFSGTAMTNSSPFRQLSASAQAFGATTSACQKFGAAEFIDLTECSGTFSDTSCAVSKLSDLAIGEPLAQGGTKLSDEMFDTRNADDQTSLATADVLDYFLDYCDPTVSLGGLQDVNGDASCKYSAPQGNRPPFGTVPEISYDDLQQLQSEGATVTDLVMRADSTTQGPLAKIEAWLDSMPQTQACQGASLKDAAVTTDRDDTHLMNMPLDMLEGLNKHQKITGDRHDAQKPLYLFTNLAAAKRQPERQARHAAFAMGTKSEASDTGKRYAAISPNISSLGLQSLHLDASIYRI